MEPSQKPGDTLTAGGNVNWYNPWGGDVSIHHILQKPLNTQMFKVICCSIGFNIK